MNTIGNSCLSCGETRNMKNRRYCSVECRQRLKYQLDIRSGLLKTLNARYATFYFTSTEIVLDILIRDSMEICSFVYPRVAGKKPVDDFIRLSNQLGKVWWSEKNRTERRYLANQMVLDQAKKREQERKWSFPGKTTTPVHVKHSMTCLRLAKADLESSNAIGYIKSAYRKMAKLHHPDQGGDSAKFRKIHVAYERLVEWSKSPVFLKRRGFVDKWFYDGMRDKWVQPLPK
jgi:hypothetical protein